ncbi:MAG: hypothetical protein D6771_09065, partial [Zetaproteobacteria bacterium]
EAAQALSERTIAGLKQEIARLAGELAQANARLAMYDEILRARATPGVQIVAPSFTRRGRQLRYRFAVVKGGSAPRWFHGRLALLAWAGEQSLPIIADDDPAATLRIETHAIVEGKADLPEGFAPREAEIVIYDRRGREIARTSQPITEEDHAQEETQNATGGHGGEHGD